MTVGEIIDDLINNESYLEARKNVSDDFIGFVEQSFPVEWEKIKPREEGLQNVIALLNEGVIKEG